MGFIEDRVENKYKDKSSKEKSELVFFGYLFIFLIFFTLIFAFSGFTIIAIITIFYSIFYNKNPIKFLAYLLVFNILITSFFKLNNGNVMNFVGVFQENIMENYSSSTHFIYVKWRNYEYYNNDEGFLNKIDFLNSIKSYENDKRRLSSLTMSDLRQDPIWLGIREMPKWDFGFGTEYEIADQKWYKRIPKLLYNKFIGLWINPDPTIEGKIKYDNINIDMGNIYNIDNYNSIQNNTLSDKEKNIIKGMIIKNSSVEVFFIDLLSIFLMVFIYRKYF